jgi:dienelactone hydrolase
MHTTPDSFLELLYSKNEPEFGFNARSVEEWSAWRQDLKTAFADAIGLGRIPVMPGKMKPCVLENVKMEGYIRQKVVFGTAESLGLSTYLLIPDIKDKRFPTVIACHGHGYGNRAAVGLTQEGYERSGDPDYHKDFPIELVKRGYLVAVPEIIGFGDRRLEEDFSKPLNESSCYRISVNLLMMGTTIAGLRIFELMRTVDYLQTREDTDAERIGCMGISGGGLVCGFSTALDERIKVAVISGYTNTFKDSIMSIHHCIDNFIPGIVCKAEMPDILGLIAPRPLLVEAGTKDHIFPIKAVHKAFDVFAGIYSLLDSDEKLDMDEFEGGHQISGHKAYDWFDRWL